MSADKPLQDIYNTVRIPVTDAGLATDNYQFTDGGNPDGYGFKYGMYWNCYPQFFTDRSQNQYSSQFDTWTTKRAPINAFSYAAIPNATIPTANLTDVWANLCISSLDDTYIAAIWDNTAALLRIIQYKPAANTALQIGTIAGAVGDTVYLTELVVSGLPYLGVTYMNAAETTTTGAYAASVAGTFVAASLTVIADVDFPANIAATNIRGQFVQVDGYTLVMSRQGGVYNSDFNSITSWNALGVILANSYPDQGVGLARYKNMIAAFSEDSIEFYTDIGTAPPASPFQRSDQATIKFGAVTAKAILTLGEAIYWWGKGSGGNWGLYKLDGGYVPVKISMMKEDVAAARQEKFPELYFLFDRGKPHIISTIKISQDLLYKSPFFGGFTGDPYGETISPGSFFDISLGYVCWDTTTLTSWVWSHSSLNLDGESLYFPIQAANFDPTRTGQSISSAVVLFSQDLPRRSTGIAGLGNRVMQAPTENVAGSSWIYRDDTLANGTTPNGITAAIAFNGWDFGNEKRKRIHKFKIIQRYYGVSSSSPVNGSGPWTWIAYSKLDGDFSSNDPQPSYTRMFVRPCKQNYPVQRTYLNNLGSARRWSFVVIQRSDMNFACRGVELEISQAG